MIKKSVVGIALALVASLVGLFAATSAYAATPTGTGPDQALSPTGKWTQAAPASTTWYGFTYSGDNAQILVSLDVVPDNGATFSIWTPEQVERWAAGQAVEPIGRGSPNPNVSGSLSWAGNFNQAGVYYVVVENNGSNASYHAVRVTGSAVTIAADTAQQAETRAATAAPVQAAAATAAKAAVETSGASPEQAFSTPAYSVSIAPGASIWHELEYAGDQSQILVWLDDLSGTGVSFSVWTPDNVRQMEMGNAVNPVGRGAVNAYAPGDLSWSGNFPQAGMYYMNVQNSGSTVATYSVYMQGSGVW